MLANQATKYNTVDVEPQTSAETDPTKQALEAFLQARQDAIPIETYDELQAAIRSEVDLPSILADYVTMHGKTKENSLGERSVYLVGKANNHIITARLDGPGTEQEKVVIHARRRTLPLMRYKQTRFVSFYTKDPTWDQAVVRQPHFEAFLPFNSSPTAVDFWASKGEVAVYGGDGARPITTTGQIAREASADAHQTFNGFLETTVWLIDRLLRTDKA